MAAGLEGRVGGELDDNAGELLVELLGADFNLAAGGVIDEGATILEAPEHHKVVEAPVDDAGELALALQQLGLDAVARGVKAV